MTTDNWLTILLIITNSIAVLLSPIIGAFVAQSLRNQPKPTPDTNQPNNLIQRMGGWLMSFLRSPWQVALLIALPGILVNTYSLRMELRNTVPITRGSVYLISMDVTGIWFSLLNMSVIWIWQSIGRHTEIINKESDIASGILELIGTVRESVTNLSASIAAVDKLHTEVENQIQAELSQTHPDKPATRALDRLLAAIKVLFGD